MFVRAIQRDFPTEHFPAVQTQDPRLEPWFEPNEYEGVSALSLVHASIGLKVAMQDRLMVCFKHESVFSKTEPKESTSCLSALLQLSTFSSNIIGESSHEARFVTLCTASGALKEGVLGEKELHKATLQQELVA